MYTDVHWDGLVISTFGLGTQTGLSSVQCKNIVAKEDNVPYHKSDREGDAADEIDN